MFHDVRRTVRAGAIAAGAVAMLAAAPGVATAQDIDLDPVLNMGALPVDDPMVTETPGTDTGLLMEGLEANVSDGPPGDDGGSAGTPISAARTGVSSAAYIGFADKTFGTLSYFRISDTACDSYSTFVQVEVEQPDGDRGYAGTYYTDGMKCGNTKYLGNRNFSGSAVKYVRLRVCVNTPGPNNRCTTGAPVLNPYYG